MGDLTRLQNSQAVQITDDSTQAVAVTTSPSGSEAGLVTRNIPYGTQTVSVSGSVSTNSVVGSFTNKSCTVGTSAAQINSGSISSTIGIQVRSSTANSGKIYIGSSSSVTAGTNASTDGFLLLSGESLMIPTNNVNLIYAISDTASQTLFFLVF